MGNLDLKFENKLNSLADAADVTADGMINQGQVAWDTLDDGGPDAPGPKRLTQSYHDEFDRVDLGKKYTEIYSKASTGLNDVQSTVGESMLVRLQYDWLMRLERDYLMRRRSRVRTEAHAAATRRMIGDENGPLKAALMHVAKKMLAIAGEKP